VDKWRVMSQFIVEVTVNHNIAHTWEFYFNQINSWWPKEFYSSPRTKQFHIQTFIGGKVYEDYGEGDGLIWGDVIGVDYLKSLELKGNLTRNFGGPVVTFEKYQFLAENGRTKLTYTIDFLGEVKPSTVASLEEGWKNLLQVHFKKYCQSKKDK
jgi:hypothetical protein